MSDSGELLHYQLGPGGGIPWDDTTAPHVCALCQPQVAHFGDALSEYRAAQQSSAVFSLSDRVQIEMTGKDARTFLHNFCSNDVKRLAPGDGCEAFITNVKGRILAHVFAFVTEHAVWLDSPPTDEERLVAHFDRYLFSEDVQLCGHTQEMGELYVAGGQSVAHLAALGIPADSLANLQHTMATVDGIRVAARRVELWNCPGFLISAQRQRLVELWQRLSAAGVQPGGAQAFHTLRIEAAFPICGIDVTEDNLAQEAGRTKQAISFTKGCYLGQEPIARIDALGHINRQVSRLRLDTETPLKSPAPVVAPDGSEVGVITSSMVVPGEQQTVALAMLRTSHGQPGTALSVQSGQEVISATVF